MDMAEQIDVAGNTKRMGPVERWDVAPEAEVLGQGVSGAVFAGNDPHRAVKVCRRCKPYSRFVDFVHHTDNPHLPKIYSVRLGKKGMFGRPTRMRVEMERLIPLDPETTDWDVINGFANTCHAVTEGRPVIVDADARDALGVLAISLGHYARENRLALDLQCANIMMRPTTGELVFVDPLR